MEEERERLTPEEMLQEVEKAICTILIGGQSYKIGSRQLTRADLKLLNEMQKELSVQTGSSGRGGGLLDHAYAAVFEGR